jgi:hypothetical protein
MQRWKYRRRCCRYSRVGLTRIGHGPSLLEIVVVNVRGIAWIRELAIDGAGAVDYLCDSRSNRVKNPQDR